MNLRGLIVVATIVWLQGCALPKTYLGIPTNIPVPSDYHAQIDGAIDTQLAACKASVVGSETGERFVITLPGGECLRSVPRCPWVTTAGALKMVSCNLLPVSQLAALAWRNDKHAALELGIRFEEGQGVPRDLDKARALYRVAAATTGGPMFVYAPGVGNAPATVVPVSQPYDYGLPEASKRLTALSGE